jgi:hypothetical protein
MTRDELIQQAKDSPEAIADTLLAERADVKRKADAEAERNRLKLAQIENMPHADLKANKDDLIEAAKLEGADALASRYVQSRTDAKLRDERMAEMGAEITELQATLAASEKAGEALAAKLADAESQITKLAGEKLALEAELAALKEPVEEPTK